MLDRSADLDGIRALSVAGVFLGGFGYFLPFGWIGVLVFYVLSGFLITRILLDERAHAGTARVFFGRFYFRRTLRIFPLYYAYLLALELVHAVTSAPAGWTDVRPFAFGYAVNVGLGLGAFEVHDAWGHLWTLAVEEQFYLLWPLAVFFTPAPRLKQVSIALVLSAPAIRLLSAEVFEMSILQLYVSSFSHVDAFAVGAVLALHQPDRMRRVLPWTLGALCITLALGLCVVAATGAAIRTLGYREGLRDGDTYVWGYTVLNVTAGLVILAALRGELPFLGRPSLAYLGRIWHGIYLFQRPIRALYQSSVEPLIAAAVPFRPLVLAIGIGLCGAVVIALAALSYRYFELPLLRYRDRIARPRTSLLDRPRSEARRAA